MPEPIEESPPEIRIGMKRDEAFRLIGPLEDNWTVYASAPHGDVAKGPVLLAALLLHDLGEATICQRRTWCATEYLIRKKR